MTVLGNHGKNLYGALLYNHGARPYYDDQPICLRKRNGKLSPDGEVGMSIDACEAMTEYIYAMQDFELSECEGGCENEITFFVWAAHIVFVPFGQAGYDFLKETVAEKLGISIGEFLYEKFVERVECPVNGNLLKDLNDGQKEYIKEFFVNFESKEDIDCSQPKDLATFACRLFFALDALLTEHNNLFDLVEEYIEPIENEILRADDEIFKFKVSDYIDSIPTRRALYAPERKYIFRPKTKAVLNESSKPLLSLIEINPRQFININSSLLG